MNLYSQSYPGRKHSRTCRFPALAQDRMRAITSALPCRCEGIRDFRCDRALPLPASSGHKPASILYRRPTQSHRVTMRRHINLETKTVKPDRAKTDRMCKSDDGTLAVRTKNAPVGSPGQTKEPLEADTATPPVQASQTTVVEQPPAQNTDHGLDIPPFCAATSGTAPSSNNLIIKPRQYRRKPR